MKVITVASDPLNPNFLLLQTSCALNGLEMVALINSEYKGNRIKDQLLLEYLKELPDDEIILFTDAYDAVFLAGEGEILSKYNKFQKELVFSGEVQPWPDLSLADKYPKGVESPYRYINCGGFMGPAGLIREILSKPVKNDTNKYKKSNQYMWSLRYLENLDRMEIDTECEIFCTFSPEFNKIIPSKPKRDWGNLGDPKRHRAWFAKIFKIENNRIHNLHTGTTPCHAHFNGFSKFLIDEQIVHLVFSQLPGSEKISHRRFELAEATA